MQAIDFLIIPIVLTGGHFIANFVAKRYGRIADRKLLLKLFYYHLAFSLLFGAYVSIFGGDSVGYWKHPGRFWTEAGWLGLHRTGTPFVYFLTYPFSQILGLSFWGGTVLFTLFGYGGIVCLYLTFIRILRVNPVLFGVRLMPLVLFLPNMHFWSGGVGKDSVIFFALCAFAFGLTNIKRNWVLLAIAFYLAFFIRPHIAMVMLIGSGLAVMVSSKGITMWWRVAFVAGAVAIFVVISPIVFDFIGVDEEAIENYEDVASIRSRNLSRSNVGSRIEIVNLPVPLKMLTFLYRPLFLDAGNILGLIVSMENLFYLALTIMAISWSNIPRLYRMPVVLKACLFICLATTYFMSSSLSNLGIIIRQKNMVMFMLVLVLLYLHAESRAVKLIRRERK